MKANTKTRKFNMIEDWQKIVQCAISRQHEFSRINEEAHYIG
jgi:hypothetical protein